jgi:hypothetical protein
MTREVMLAEIRLGFDDTPARDTVSRLAFEHTTEQVSGDKLSGARVKVTW